jgi:uncharacterized protein (DUF2336 family)
MANSVDSITIDQPHGMHAATTSRVIVIGELEAAIERASVHRCNKIITHVTDLFVDGLLRHSGDDIDVFDDIMSRLVLASDAPARAMLACRLACIAKAPAQVVHLLANDADIEVAKPILAQSDHLDQQGLLRIARTGDQPHLRAIAQGKSIAAEVTDVLVKRGDNEVLRALVDNADAKLSETSFARLVDRCKDDDALAASVGARPDISHQLFQKLLITVSESVRSNFVAANLPVRVEFSCVEPHFIFVADGQSLLAA